ncbi:MAG: hypothetical protein ACYC36_02630 [Bellilinea sp.]
MAKLVSVQTMKAQVIGLIGTTDLSKWETEFVESIQQRGALSVKQEAVLTSIWRKHFAG